MAKGKSGTTQLVGSWSFLVGCVLAVLLGLALGPTQPYVGTMTWVVFLLGLVVGLLNIAHDESSSFLTAGTVLVLVSYLGTAGGFFEGVAPQIHGILTGILTLFVPATVVVALKSVFVLARN